MLIPKLRSQLEKALLWILQAPLRITCAVLFFGVSAALIEAMLHLAAHSLQASPLAQALTDSLLIGVFAAFFAVLALTGASHRHSKLRDDLRRIADLNHQVRNALQVIVYRENAPTTPQARAEILESVEKIQAALQQLFPLVEQRTPQRPWESHNRQRLHRYSASADRRTPSS